MENKPSLVFTGGGTAGHIMPCVALIERLKNDYAIHYIGSENGMERDIISVIAGVTYHSITTVKLVRSLSLKNLCIPFKLTRGIKEAKRLLRQINPAAVFSKGGYVALPVTIAAGKKYPVVCHESDMTTGLSNRFAARKAVYFCGSFENAVKGRANGVFTGLPIRRTIYVPKQKTARPVLLIMGGSLGAAAINKCVAESLPELTKRYDVVHLTGKGKRIEYTSAAYTQMEFCRSMGSLYSRAAVAVSRGGGAALFELIALKIPSVIIPLPKGVSRGDQIDNAAYFEAQGLCRVLMEDSLNPQSLSAAIEQCIKDENLKKNLEAAQNIDGTEKVAELIVRAAEKNGINK